MTMDVRSGPFKRWSKRLAPLVATVTMVGGFVVLAGQADAAVTTVHGSAYGFFTNVSLFNSPFSTRGPAPRVQLPPGGSAVAVTASHPAEVAQYGPATIFSSGKEFVSTRGTPAGGAVVSYAFLANVNSGPFTARAVSSTCKARQAGVSGSTTIANGKLVTKTDASGNPVTTVSVPVNPAPNTTYTGTIDNVGDSFKFVFNEQIVQRDGKIVVNAGHDYLLGPTAKGDVIFGESVCGVR
ncbi:MAG: hypothetical protein M3083_09870 [Actinomycetota bacterium]|nr:hypothetical protein [Actinomycetota bacterium]